MTIVVSLFIKFTNSLSESSTLILLRHGESAWNRINTFTGWADVSLTKPHGENQAAMAGTMLLQSGLKVDIAHTSSLQRAHETLRLALKNANYPHQVPVQKSWKLNERNYGMLTGLHKVDVKERLGEEMGSTFRRNCDATPILMNNVHPLYDHIYDRDRYAELSDSEFDRLPKGESLADCQERVVAYYDDVISPELKEGKTVLIAAHNNALRALMMHIDSCDPRGGAMKAEIPKAIPIVYKLDRDSLESLMPIKANGFSAEFLGVEIKRDAASESAASERDATGPSSHWVDSRTGDFFTQESLNNGLEIKLDQVISVDEIHREMKRMGIREETVPYLTDGSNTSPSHSRARAISLANFSTGLSKLGSTLYEKPLKTTKT